MTEKLSKSQTEAIEKITALREYMTERLHSYVFLCDFCIARVD